MQCFVKMARTPGRTFWKQYHRLHGQSSMANRVFVLGIICHFYSQWGKEPEPTLALIDVMLSEISKQPDNPEIPRSRYWHIFIPNAKSLWLTMTATFLPLLGLTECLWTWWGSYEFVFPLAFVCLLNPLSRSICIPMTHINMSHKLNSYNGNE